MKTRRAYQFNPKTMAEVCAHHGKGLIQTIRVEEKCKLGAANFIDLTILPPGSSIGTHTHTHDNEEIYIVVSGYGTMALGDEKFSVAPGDVIVNRPGGTHGLINSGNEEIRIVVVEVPIGP